MMDLRSIKPIHKVCPKCGKIQLFIEVDTFGLREYCVCGFSYDLPDYNVKAHTPTKNLKR